MDTSIAQTLAVTTATGSAGYESPVVVSEQFNWTPDDLKALHDSTCKELSAAEFKVFVLDAKRRGLDPFAKQIYAWKGEGGKLTTQVSIDGMRTLAERTGKYRGQLGPFWCGDDGEWVDKWLSNKAPTACKVAVLRAGFREPMWGFARTAAYAKNNTFWNKMPDVMVAKVAESVALRKTFPQVLGGIYIPEEIDSAPDDNAAYVDADLPTTVQEVPAVNPGSTMQRLREFQGITERSKPITWESLRKDAQSDLGIDDLTWKAARKKYPTLEAMKNALDAQRAQNLDIRDATPDVMTEEQHLERLHIKANQQGYSAEQWESLKEDCHDDLDQIAQALEANEQHDLRALNSAKSSKGVH